ncbi:MAG: LamG-like jellyroll fold domain-containing protein [Planctomycetota bacterium]
MDTRRLFVAGIALAATALLGGRAGAQTLLHYDFTDGSGTQVTDLSASGNDGTLTGFADTSAGAGVFGVSEGWVGGGGLSFLDDGVRSYVQTPLSQSAVNGGDFTVEFMASADGPGDWTPAVGSDQSAFDGAETFFLGINNGLSFIEARVPPSGGGVGSPAAPIPWALPGDQSDPTPHHVALTYRQAANRFAVYVDGEQTGTETRGSLVPATSNFIVGNTGHAAGEQWDGVISGVAVSNAALEPSELVLAQYAEPEPEVLLHYRFTDGSGTQVTDLSGNDHHGTLVGFSDTSAGAGAFGQGEGWVSGGGLSFLDDGVRSFVQTPLSQGAVNGGDFTIEFMASADGPSSWTPAIGSDHGPGFSPAETFFLGINNGLSFIEARVPPDGGGIDSPAVPIPWALPGDQSDDVLHHVALTFDSAAGVFELYIDGQFEGSETRGGLDPALSNFIIGNTGHAAGEQWDGIIAGVAITGGVLDPDAFVLLQPLDVIPEPATLGLLGLGALGLARRRRDRS